MGYSSGTSGTIGPIQINSGSSSATLSSYTIDSDGKINVTLSDNTTSTRGQILLATVPTNSALTSAGDNLYSAGSETITTAVAGSSGLGTI